MDIPLRNAQFLWDHYSEDSDLPPVKIVDGSKGDDPDYMASWGVCNTDFVEASDAEKLLMLFLQFHKLVTTEGIEPNLVHEAFMIIPEYREALLTFTPELIPARYHSDD